MTLRRLTDTDHGYRALGQRLAEMGRPQITVGVHTSEASKKEIHPSAKKTLKTSYAKAKDALATAGVSLRQSAATVLDVASWAEFGTAREPQRSWLRAWYDEYYRQAQTDIAKVMQSVIKGKTPLPKALEQLGQRFVGLIQKRIARGIAPPNAPSTVAVKGSSKPLINFGQFRSAITYSVRSGK